MSKLARSFAAVALSLSALTVPVRAQRLVANVAIPNSTPTVTTTADMHTVPGSRISFWKSADNDNIMRLEELPNGEMKFWAHSVDAKNGMTRNSLAEHGLNIKPEQMTDEFAYRYCNFGSDNGVKVMRVTSSPRENEFRAVARIGHDFFRGVENPKYGERDWEVKITRPKDTDNKINVEVRLMGPEGGALRFAGLFVGKGSANRFEGQMKRVEGIPEGCTASSVYPIKTP